MHINLLFIFMLSAFSVISAKPVLVLSESVVDFGEVNIADGSQTRMLVIKNDGDEPMVVNQVSSTCHCVETEWPAKPIMPASADSIRIIYTPDMSGVVSKKLIIYSNAKNRRTVFRVKALAVRNR